MYWKTVSKGEDFDKNGERKKRLNEDLHSLNHSPNIVRVIYLGIRVVDGRKILVSLINETG